MLKDGDCVADLDIPKVLDFHRSHGRLATVTTVRPMSRFGAVHLDQTSEVIRFAEKPQSEGWVSAGFFVFERGVFDYLGSDDCILEREPLERLSADKILMAYRHEGFIYAMDPFRDY